jgi:hypothetical protein
VITSKRIRLIGLSVGTDVKRDTDVLKCWVANSLQTRANIIWEGCQNTVIQQIKGKQYTRVDFEYDGLEVEAGNPVTIVV